MMGFILPIICARWRSKANPLAGETHNLFDRY
jgi:hypothetical protein